MKAKNQIAGCLAGIMSLVVMPALVLAQPARSYTAPAPVSSAEGIKSETPKQYEGRRINPELAPPIEILRVNAGNPENLDPGFYASYTPETFDTVFVYEGGTEEFTVVGVHSGKEVIHSPDSLNVAHDVRIRMNYFNEEGIPVANEKKITTNSAVIRSGIIPAQGFGSKRYRFAVKPANLQMTPMTMISASVHMRPENNIGNVLCSVTSIDYKKGIFYVEASNEIPLGECINWIIVNTP